MAETAEKQAKKPPKQRQPHSSIGRALDGEFGMHEVALAVRGGNDFEEIAAAIVRGIAEGRCKDTPLAVCQIALHSIRERDAEVDPEGD